MQNRHRVALFVAACASAAACVGGDRVVGTAASDGAGQAALHVGYKGPAVEVGAGYVDNSAECHVGKKGNRWPQQEWWESIAQDAEIVVTPSGRITLVCKAPMAATTLLGAPVVAPDHTVIETGVLCFLPGIPGVPGTRETRDAQEVFTPSGWVILTCHYNPEKSAS